MEEIYRKVASELVKVYNHGSLLVFPKYYNNDVKEIRISEQESRVLFTHVFLSKGIPFSVEVPTQSKYSFSGKKSRSARYDLGIYHKQTEGLSCIIELKAHNPEFEQIRKDIEKFACSDLDCIWFHTLEKTTARTYKTLFDKFNKAFQKETPKIKGTHQWTFVIVVLQSKQLFTFSARVSKTSKVHFDSINDFSSESL